MDFANLRRNLEKDHKVVTFGPIEQRKFLTNMGAEARMETLLASCNEEEKKALESGYEMLSSPQQMGDRFKFLSIFPSVLSDHLSKFPVNGF